MWTASIRTNRVIPLILTVALFAPGCSVWTGSAFEDQQAQLPPPPVDHDPASPIVDTLAIAHPAVVQRESISIPPDPELAAPPADYVVGPGDILYVNVIGDPHLSSTVLAGDRALGSRVDGAGYVQLPLVNSVQVAGLTLTQTRQKLQEAYTKFITQPWIVVEVVEHQSQPLYLVGEFNSPGVYYMDRPTNILQAMAIGHGIKPESDFRGARLMRNNRVLPVDIYRLLHEGSFDHNIWLQPYDTIFVPDNRDQVVYILGEVPNPGAVPMVRGRLTLTEAFALVGAAPKSGTDLQRVGIIRSLSPTRGELIVVDFEKILNGTALPFPLMPGDIIYVPRSEWGEWNDAIADILPSLQLIGAALQPFVQVKFLSN
jgi:polysaccharide export outer membrane protein